MRVGTYTIHRENSAGR